MPCTSDPHVLSSPLISSEYLVICPSSRQAGFPRVAVLDLLPNEAVRGVGGVKDGEQESRRSVNWIKEELDGYYAIKENWTKEKDEALQLNKRYYEVPDTERCTDLDNHCYVSEPATYTRKSGLY